MEYSKKVELTDKIIFLTLQGPVSGWTDRISEIAKRAELSLELINWNRNPRVLSTDIVGIADNNKKLDKLVEIVRELEVETLGIKEAEETSIKMLLMATTKDLYLKPIATFSSQNLVEKYIEEATENENSFKNGTLLQDCISPLVIIALDPNKLPSDPIVVI